MIFPSIPIAFQAYLLHSIYIELSPSQLGARHSVQANIYIFASMYYLTHSIYVSHFLLNELINDKIDDEGTGTFGCILFVNIYNFYS